MNRLPLHRHELSDFQIGRFRQRIKTGAPDECWPWTGAAFSNGYGLFHIKGRKSAVGAHRISWLIAHRRHIKTLEAGDEVCHRCDNRICVNPNHLFRGSHEENMADARKKGLITPLKPRPGTLNVNAKLDEAKIAEIRRQAWRGRAQRAIAAEFGIAQCTVWQIVHRRTWTHVA